ncbi:putative ABC transport system ATP-binding protein [Frankia sp. AiPs1]|uniref:ABC transporter ATP-binding protein n=1 Tax=Frankia sp. AiPa1 TaxID=573492 RepID=UPI00202B785F|nr:ATP-binding cassette domain-containing protein [Frankia sp. AiPa1]MCL9758116.1 ABC transporter ATP-binding protein [Frankia sp. AiPa1]
MHGDTYVVGLEQVVKSYGDGLAGVKALDGVSLEFRRGAFTAVMGPSGSGKSTLLHCAAGLDRPTSGSVWLSGHDLGRVPEPELTELRRREMGFVFQAFNLVESLTAQENITLPFRLSGTRPDRQWVREIVARTGLQDRVRHRPAALSGGQQQRVAIARALVTRPAIVFADEPTGALDQESGRGVLRLLREAVDHYGQSVVMVTHDAAAAEYADEVVFLSDGRVVDTIVQPSAEAVSQRMLRLGG